MRYSYDDPEIWQTINDYPDYAFSSWGRLWNVVYDNQIIGYSFSPDYPIKVKIKDWRGHTTTRLLHRLIARAFYTGYEDDAQVYFVNGDKYDCHILNLRFVRQGVGQFKGGLETLMIRRLHTSEGQLYRSVREAAKELGVDPAEIYDVIEGRRGGIRGVKFWWAWAEEMPSEYQPVFRPDGRALQVEQW